MGMPFDFELEDILIFNYFLAFCTLGAPGKPPAVWAHCVVKLFNRKILRRKINLGSRHYNTNPWVLSKYLSGNAPIHQSL